MDIGSGYSLTSCTLAQDVFYAGPEPLAPLPGILDAPKVVILGASIAAGAFGDGGGIAPEVQGFATAFGFTGNVVSYAQAGDKLADTIAKHATAKAEQSATEGSNLYIVHSGGNNVSPNRPYSGGAATLEADYTTLLDNITATDLALPLPLTKRLYGRAVEGYPNNPQDVVHGNPTTEQYGSLPYNEAIIYPLIDDYAPDWRVTGQVPFVNPYELADRNPDLLLADGTHGYSHSFARYILARTAARALGQDKSTSRAGKSLLYEFGKGNPIYATIGPINNTLSFANGLNYSVFFGAQFYDGSVDGFSDLRVSTYQNGSATGGAGAEAFGRVADTRFHDAMILSKYIYAQAATPIRVTVSGLTVGDMVTVTVVGSRNSGGTIRRGNVTLNGGETLELDASNIAASNQVMFSPITVPASGEIVIDVVVASGSTYAYLSALALDFS